MDDRLANEPDKRHPDAPAARLDATQFCHFSSARVELAGGDKVAGEVTSCFVGGRLAYRILTPDLWGSRIELDCLRVYWKSCRY